LEGLYELGVRIFSDDGDSVADTVLLARIMSRLADLPGAVLAQHAEDRAMTAGGQMHQGAVSERLGLSGLPAEAETSVVARDLELVRKSGVKYHCQHISAGATLGEVSRAKKEGFDVTAEVTPHHLVFTDLDVVSIGTNLKMYPPVRGNDDREALVTALKSGLIDIVATDHAPHSSEEKAVSFADAPRGVIGLETAASAVWQTLGDPLRFFEVMSGAPARLAGFVDQGLPLQAGNTANLVVFDREEKWTVGEFRSRSANSPFTGTTMTGRVKTTIYQGKITHGMSTANV
ncbi:MAG: amidohydrolase family protein, partial [Acidimicrobiia bacterium]